MSGTFKIVLLEDDFTHITLVKHHLKKLNTSLELDVYTDWHEFESGFQQSNPDLLISDYHLGEFTALNAMELAHSIYPDLPVILITGYLEEKEAIKTMQLGASDIILKDNLNRFLPAVERELKNYNARKEKEIALQETKERYRALVHSVKGIVWEATLDPFSFTYVSPKIRDLLGYDIKYWYDDACNFFDHIAQPDQDRVKHFYTHFNDRTGNTHLEYRIKNQAGETVWFHDSLSYNNLKDGTVVIRGMMTDISDTKTREILLKKTVNEKEALISEVHHRVKNNLAVVSGMMQLQVYTETNTQVKFKLNDSISRIKTMANIHEVLYSSLSSTAVFGSDNIVQLVTDIIEQFQTVHKTKKVNIDYNLSAVRLNINYAVPIALIINEVLTNCLKHAFSDDQDDRKISFTLTQQNNWIQLSIVDNGSGISENVLDQKKPNSLGLTIISALATQLDAEYEYTSLVPGTAFSFKFQPRV